MPHGLTSLSQESKQKLIVLKEDEPDAVEHVLRHLYGCTLPQDNKPWRLWLALVAAADKYLEPELSSAAGERLMHKAQTLESLKYTNHVFDIIQELKANMAHHQSLLDFAEQLRKKHLEYLLKDKRYRELLVSDPALMLAQLDELEVPRKLAQKVYYVCNEHADSSFRVLRDRYSTRCIACFSKEVLPGRIAYLPAE